jgi:cell wall-associated NlpC family hydrolase
VRAALTVTTLVGGVIVPAVPALAGADARPSASDVAARSEEDIRRRAAAVGRVKGKLARANADLQHLTTRAAGAIERYNGEVVKLEHARRASADARVQLAAAERRLAAARAELASFAANAYRANAAYGSWTSVIGADGGPQGFIDRAGLVQVMAQRQADLLERVRAAKIIGAMYRRRADDSVRAQRAALGRADGAKRAAEAAVVQRRQAVREIAATRAGLMARLSEAERRAMRLRRATGAVAAPAGGGSGRGALRIRGPRRGVTVANAALRWLGTPYSWGGGTAAGPSYGIEHGAGIKGFDCSGLALYAWAKAGVRLDHWTGTQWTSGRHVPTGRLRPGDLVFFATDTDDPGTIHHVGIYIGRGRMVEAPYTGARVRISSIWRSELIGATRPAA